MGFHNQVEDWGALVAMQPGAASASAEGCSVGHIGILKLLLHADPVQSPKED